MGGTYEKNNKSLAYNPFGATMPRNETEPEMIALLVQNHKKIIDFCSELDPQRFPESIAIVHGNVATMAGFQKLYERMKKQSKTERGMKKQLKEAENMIMSANLLRRQSVMHQFKSEVREEKARGGIRFRGSMLEGIAGMRRRNEEKQKAERLLGEAERKIDKKKYFDAVLLVRKAEQDFNYTPRGQQLFCEAVSAAFVEAGVMTDLLPGKNRKRGTEHPMYIQIEGGFFSSKSSEQALGAILYCERVSTDNGRSREYARQLVASVLEEIDIRSHRSYPSNERGINDQRLLGELVLRGSHEQGKYALGKITSGAVLLDCYVRMRFKGRIHDPNMYLIISKMAQIGEHEPEFKKKVMSELLMTIPNIIQVLVTQVKYGRSHEIAKQALEDLRKAGMYSYLKGSD